MRGAHSISAFKNHKHKRAIPPRALAGVDASYKTQRPHALASHHPSDQPRSRTTAFAAAAFPKMSVEILDGSTVQSFVDDEGAFNTSVDGRFAALDADRDGLLSYAEMAGELMSLRVLERHFGADDDDDAARLGADGLAALYRGLFARFDRDGDGKVDLHEFRAEMKEVMLAVANGLGFLPVQMVVEEGSFLKMAVDRELAKAA